jgi:Plasmid pRiA4b ORF-3-like protein
MPGGGLERSCTRRDAQHMKPSPVLPSIYQLRIVLRGMSPLIWRRLLVHSDTTLAHLHDILQIVFDRSEEHLGFQE